MSGSQIRKQILEILWESGKPIRAQEIAQKTGISVPSSRMHLLKLIKAEHVSTPEKGYYIITEKGKEELGLPRIDKDKASKILNPVSIERAFHFYTGINQSLNVCATSLNDFCEKIEKINTKSVEFHVSRGDFEIWIRDIGDPELARRINSIKNRGIQGNDLQKTIHEIVKNRCEELSNVSRGAHEAYIVYEIAH